MHLYPPFSRGLCIQPEKNISEICIFLGEFILIESEDIDQQSVAKLVKLYENGKFYIF